MSTMSTISRIGAVCELASIASSMRGHGIHLGSIPFLPAPAGILIAGDKGDNVTRVGLQIVLDLDLN